MPKSFFTKRYKIFRDELQKARVDAGLSQEELATKLGWDQSLISKIERGVRRIDVVELITVCDALGIDVARFLQTLKGKYQSKS